MTIRQLGKKLEKLGVYKLGDDRDYILFLDNENGSYRCESIYYCDYSKELKIEVCEYTFRVKNVMVEEGQIKVELDHSIYDTEFFSNRSNYACYYDEYKPTSKVYNFTLQKVTRSYSDVDLLS